MSAADLWQDYQKDARGADGRYWGRAVEISGPLSSSDVSNPAAPSLLFAQAGGRGVRARLLDEDAPAILKAVVVGQRVRLLCFCEGFRGRRDSEELHPEIAVSSGRRHSRFSPCVAG